MDHIGRAELASILVVRGPLFAHVIGSATRDVDASQSGVVRVVRNLMALGRDAVKARQSHAAEDLVGGVVLHVQHNKVIDLALPRRRLTLGSDLAKACANLFR